VARRDCPVGRFSQGNCRCRLAFDIQPLPRSIS
jgi:hypothetical protein